MVELKGSLDGIGLPAIVQLIGDLHHSGSLELTNGAAHGVLSFDDGRLVDATFGAESGFQALTACGVKLAEGEFTFVEGMPVGERSLDLSAGELQRQLRSIVKGQAPAVSTVGDAATLAAEDVDTVICPLLGFADDRSRHYSRSTALHRCYASGAPSLITGREQRELCLGGRYPTCARYRNAVPATHEATDSHVAPTPVLPAGVAARTAAATNQLHLANSTTETHVPDWIGQQDDAPPSAAGDHDPQRADSRPDSLKTVAARYLPTPRGLALIAGGVVLGLLVILVALIVVTLPGANPSPAPKTVNTATSPTQVFAPVPSAADRTPISTSAPAVAAARATSVPTAASTSTAVPRPPAPTTAPPSAASGARPLIDVRFAAGVPTDWLDNAPFAAWSDGAYRLQARQAARFVAVAAPLAAPLRDVIVSATFRKTGGPPGGGYGLIVRDRGPEPRDGVNQNMAAYVLEAGDLGEFGVWRRDGDHWVDLVPWTRSSAVRFGGSPNDLTVRASGDQLTFTINGVDLATVQDKAPSMGAVGVFVGGDYNEVAIDRFIVQVP
jgi:hypothetical protein